MSDTHRCKWHKCKKEFEAAHGNQRYCGSACRVKRMDWAANRGSRIVNLILDCDPKNLHAVAFDEQQKLLEEINGFAPGR